MFYNRYTEFEIDVEREWKDSRIEEHSFATLSRADTNLLTSFICLVVSAVQVGLYVISLVLSGSAVSISAGLGLMYLSSLLIKGFCPLD